MNQVNRKKAVLILRRPFIGGVNDNAGYNDQIVGPALLTTGAGLGLFAAFEIDNATYSHHIEKEQENKRSGQ